MSSVRPGRESASAADSDSHDILMKSADAVLSGSCPERVGHCDKRIGNLRVKRSTSFFCDRGHRPGMADGRFVYTIADEGIVGVGQRDNSAGQRDIFLA